MNIVVGLSGGVDSAVAALLLKQQGHAVTGLFMKNWEEDDTHTECSAEEDLKVVRAVCAQLDIPLRTVNFSAEYWDRVFSYFLEEHKRGRTPNPDVLCNKEIKFKAFLDHALGLGAEAIATGHYARIEQRDGRYALLKARDTQKDQTYFLYPLGQAELTRTLFPVGHLTKPEGRALARAAGLPNHDRKDSTGICFMGERVFKGFLARYLPAQPGDMCALSGERLGSHDGLMYYTLGQRHGLGLGGAGEAWYVAGKDLVSNTLYVVQGENHPALLSRGLEANDLHWIAGMPPTLPLVCAAKTRYRQSDQPCVLTRSPEALDVRFESLQRALTPGQSVVLYAGEECLGGGVIQRAVATARADAVTVPA